MLFGLPHIGEDVLDKCVSAALFNTFTHKRRCDLILISNKNGEIATKRDNHIGFNGVKYITYPLRAHSHFTFVAMESFSPKTFYFSANSRTRINSAKP